MIKHYNNKTGAGAAGYMYPRFTFPPLSFSFNLATAISINVDLDITQITPPPPAPKAKYGTAKYDIDYFDPLTVLGVIVPDTLTKYLLVRMVKSFLPATYRGYKYAIWDSFTFLIASLPMLETFAPDPVWFVRLRKMEAGRSWGMFMDLSFVDVNAVPLDPTLDGHTWEGLIRVSDMLQSCVSFMTADYGYCDFPPTLLVDLGGVAPRTSRNNNLTSDLMDHGLVDRLPCAGVCFPYPEVYVMFPCTCPYVPVMDVFNVDYDVCETTVDFNEDVASDIIETFKQTTQPAYQQLINFTGDKRMKSKFQIHATYQIIMTQLIRRILSDTTASVTDIAKYNAFGLEYSYARNFEQLIDAEKVITKYIRLGLTESVLRQIASAIQR
jgi:hypothetical protein